jgi:hypothetical protein
MTVGLVLLVLGVAGATTSRIDVTIAAWLTFLGGIFWLGLRVLRTRDKGRRGENAGDQCGCRRDAYE